MAKKKTTYEVHPREYTLVGISAAMQEFFSLDFPRYCGKTFKEIVLIIKDNQFYHIQINGDREKVSKSFLNKINRGEVNYKKEYQNYIKLVKGYEKLLALPEKKFKLQTLNDFYFYYRILIKYSYLTFDTIDYLDFVEPKLRADYKKWITHLRLRGEKIYKDGEHDFVPKYLTWLKKNYLPDYQVDDLKYLYFKELEDYIKQGKKLPARKKLLARKKIFFVRQYPVDRFKILEGIKAKLAIKKRGFFVKEKIGKLKEFKGQAAFSGHVKAKVRLISKREDMMKFREGEIVVSVMTEPGYLPIMKKAAAFITDEGGVLCHAAIVARELKKPCIIGTKIATKVLKDGDLVEVDANKGIVKILK